MQNMDESTTNWGIVELMGHKVVAGRISKSETIGAPLMRVDVPATSIYPEFTQFYGTSAIYCVTFVSEEVARRTAEANKVNPVSVYVPDLVTREQLEEAKATYEKRLEQMRQFKGLPAGEIRCTWMHDADEDSNAWKTSCGNVWELDDGDPADNNVQYCMFCGRSVEIYNLDDGDTRVVQTARHGGEE